MKSQTVIIRRYANRRLYDTSAGRYVNLEDVASLIRQGRDVKVVDAKTGQDRTRVVLTQIITEDAKEQPTGLPLELLRQLIMATDRAGQEFIMWYLKQAFDAYQTVQQTIQTRFTDVRSAALSPLNIVKDLITPAPAAQESELEHLRERIRDMEGRAKPARRKRRGRG